MKSIFPKLFLALFIALVPVAQAEDPSRTIGNTREELEEVQERMDKEQRKIRKSEKRERSILGDLDTIDREMARIRSKVRTLSRQERILKGKIEDSETKLRDIRKQRGKTAERLSMRSAALYKAGHLSYLKVMLSSAGIEDLERRSYYLKKLAENDSGLFQLSTELYHNEKGQVEALRSAKASLVSTLRDQEESIDVLARKKRDKDLLLAAARDKKEKHTTLLQELEASASHLKKLLEALQLQAKTGESAFPTLKGSLKRPVSGKIVKSYGRNRTGRFNTYTLSSGITIQSAEGTPIRSVYGGKVIFADWFSGYGRIIIIDHGGGFYTLYGHLLELKAETGHQVEADEVIGLVGDSGSLEGPALYFEIRHHGRPIDPGPWFKG